MRRLMLLSSHSTIWNSIEIERNDVISSEPETIS